MFGFRYITVDEEYEQRAIWELEPKYVDEDHVWYNPNGNFIELSRFEDFLFMLKPDTCYEISELLMCKVFIA
jgi:hypothetical protein